MTQGSIELWVHVMNTGCLSHRCNGEWAGNFQVVCTFYFLSFPPGLLQIFDCSFLLHARLSVYMCIQRWNFYAVGFKIDTFFKLLCPEQMVPGIAGCRLPSGLPDFGLAGCLNMMLKPFADPFSLSTIRDPSGWQNEPERISYVPPITRTASTQFSSLTSLFAIKCIPEVTSIRMQLKYGNMTRGSPFIMREYLPRFGPSLSQQPQQQG